MQRQVNSVHVNHPMAKHHRIGNDEIVFSKQDVKGIRQPYDDPLVIILAIEGFNTRRVLVDNGSSADMMYTTAFQQMKLEPKCLKPSGSLLVSFSRDRVYPKGIIPLQITAGTYPAQLMRMVDFLIVDCPLSYNVILGRLTLNHLKAVTSTYFLKVKLPTPMELEKSQGTNFWLGNVTKQSWHLEKITLGCQKKDHPNPMRSQKMQCQQKEIHPKPPRQERNFNRL